MEIAICRNLSLFWKSQELAFGAYTFDSQGRGAAIVDENE